MIHRLMFLCILVIPSFGIAQNLIPNPSFEDTICSWPGFEDPFDYPFFVPAEHWFNPNGATPDFYSVSHSEGWDCFYFSMYDPVWAEVGEWQFPKDGERMSALWVGDGLSMSRDLLEVKLLEPLQADSGYCFSMFVSLGNRQNLAIDRIGAFFSMDSLYNHMWPGGFDLPMQVTSPSGVFLTDTAEWMLVEGVYTAQGGEEFILIGNAFDDSETSYIEVEGSEGGWDVAKYFVDDLKLIPCSAVGLEESLAISLEIRTIAPAMVQLLAPVGLRYEVFDLKGSIVTTGTTINLTSILNLSSNSGGIYLLRWQFEDQFGTQRFVVHR